MYEEEAARIADYAARLAELRKCLDVDGKRTQVTRLEKEATASGFWNDPERAQKTLQRLKSLKETIAAPDALQHELEDARVLVELGQAEGDQTMGQELTSLVASLEEKLKGLELTSLFTDLRDEKDAIISIHPGAGGTESCDWADMLYRMVVRWCERHEYNVEVVDLQPGDEAGIKSATMSISGPFAYGHLRSEAGVHRLVRISPFDASRRRHTSFAAIDVVARIDESIHIDIKDEEVKMDVFRARGPGGQKVNKTSSAVRLTHLPTGIVVACQVERSQHRNRAMAMDLLRARLYDLEQKKKEEEQATRREDQQEVAWGSQIRSYVLHPYRMVKDHRTLVETGNVDRVLDGDIDLFIEGYLKWNLERRDHS